MKYPTLIGIEGAIDRKAPVHWGAAVALLPDGRVLNAASGRTMTMARFDELVAEGHVSRLPGTRIGVAEPVPQVVALLSYRLPLHALMAPAGPVRWRLRSWCVVAAFQTFGTFGVWAEQCAGVLLVGGHRAAADVLDHRLVGERLRAAGGEG